MSPPSSRRAAGHPAGRTQDFDLHGIVCVRVVDGTTDDIAKVRRQLGPIEATSDREADITIRFVDELRTGPLTYVGVGDSGFDDDTFVLLRGRGGAEGRTSVSFDHIARGAEIVCERRLPAVPHLLAIINLTALAKGVLPLHATAFTSGSTGVLVTGWSKGGKTEALLGCMSDGADYVGDEWVYLTDDGRMLGLPEPVRVWDWQLAQLPHLLEARPAGDRRRLAAWRGLTRVAASAARHRLPGSSLARRARPVLGRQTFLQIPPADLFGAGQVALQGHLDAVVLVMSHEDPRTLTRPVTADDALSPVPVRLPGPLQPRDRHRDRARVQAARRPARRPACRQGPAPAPVRPPHPRPHGDGRGEDRVRRSGDRHRLPTGTVGVMTEARG
jgi:hypothetical protein